MVRPSARVNAFSVQLRSEGNSPHAVNTDRLCRPRLVRSDGASANGSVLGTGNHRQWIGVHHGERGNGSIERTWNLDPLAAVHMIQRVRRGREDVPVGVNWPRQGRDRGIQIANPSIRESIQSVGRPDHRYRTGGDSSRITETGGIERPIPPSVHTGSRRYEWTIKCNDRGFDSTPVMELARLEIDRIDRSTVVADNTVFTVPPDRCRWVGQLECPKRFTVTKEDDIGCRHEYRLIDGDDVARRTPLAETELANSIGCDREGDQTDITGEIQDPCSNACIEHPFFGELIHIRAMVTGEKALLCHVGSEPLCRWLSDTLAMELFGSSGIRDVVGEGLTPGFVITIGAAVGSVLAADRIAVGRDTRLSGPMLEQAVSAGITAVGTDVVRLGMLPTPAIQTMAARHGMPAIVVTASHNPPEYNGVKLIGADGIELPPSTLERIESLVLDGRPEYVTWERTGAITQLTGGRQSYVDEIVAGVDRTAIDQAALTVALDPGHGAAAVTTPTILRQLGCRVVSINGDPDGRFPGRNPEPVPDALEDLCRLVRAADADLGIAHDGDGDRAIFVDSGGSPIDGDTSLAALAESVIDAGDVVVSAVNVSQRLVDAVDRREGRLELTPIGSTNIVNRIGECRAANDQVPIAGEGNGGIFFPPFAVRRDGGYTAAKMLELIALRETNIDEIIKPYTGYEKVRHSIRYVDPDERDHLWRAISAEVKAIADSADATVSHVDGIRLDLDDGWVLARPSGTEPVIRVQAEGTDLSAVEALADRLLSAARSAGPAR